MIVEAQAALAEQMRRYHCAALIGQDTTRARTTTLMAEHHALARRMIERQDDYCGSPRRSLGAHGMDRSLWS